MIVLEAKNISKTYLNGGSKNEVLHSISLQITQGEFVIITGPSGSGKTTLLNVISGLEKVTEGKINLMNDDLSQIKDPEMAKLRQTKIGYVFQSYNLLPNLTVYENIAIASVIAGKENKSRIIELLTKFNLINFKGYYPNQISGGMQQRIAIIRALINDPEIIFADEPTGNLDTKSGLEVMETLQLLHKQYNKTIVIVTHSLDHLKYGTRHIGIVDGKIVIDEEI